jgi:hypothetical protein
MRLPSKKAVSSKVFLMDKVTSKEDYYSEIASYETQLHAADRLAIYDKHSRHEIPTHFEILCHNSLFFKNLLNSQQSLSLPDFCSLKVLRVVLMSILNGQVFVWDKQTIEECFQLTRALDYFCCNGLVTQMETYLISRLNSVNAFRIL